MIDQIQANKLLFIDIESCGSYATLEELEDKTPSLKTITSKKKEPKPHHNQLEFVFGLNFTS